MKNDKGQVAIFIIVGAVLFIGLTIFFLVRSPDISLPTGNEFTPERYMSSCVRQSVRDTMDVILPQGGVLAPQSFVSVNGTPVAYLCTNVNYFQPCINQYPRYIYHLQEEVRTALVDDVESCLDELSAELERRQYSVTQGAHEIKVTLKPELVEISLPIRMTLTKNGVSQEITHLDSVIRSPLYDLGSVVSEIVAQEAQYCYFEYVGYMLLYPTYDIRVVTRSDATKIYTVTHLPSDSSLRFAVRGCAIPAGI